MKKKLLIADTLLIIITSVMFMYYGFFSHSYGLAALEEVGKVVLCLCGLGIEIIILIVLAVMWLYKRWKK